MSPCRPLARRLTALATSLTALAIPLVAQAGGIEFPDNGTVALGRGGANAALPDDGLAVHFNPAALAWQRGSRLTLGTNVIQKNLTFTRRYSDGSMADPIQNDSGLFPAPHLFYTDDFGLKNWGFGFGAYGPSSAGANNYPRDGAQRYMLVETDVILGYLSFAAAYAVTPELAFGATLQWTMAPNMHFGLVTTTFMDKSESAHCDQPGQTEANQGTACDFDPTAFDSFTSVDASMWFAPALRLGASWRPSPNWSFALAGRVTPIEVRNEGKVKLQVSEDMKKLGTITHPDNGVALTMTLPWTAVAAARYGAGPDGKAWDLEADLTYEAWSSLDALRLEFDGPLNLQLNASTDPDKINVIPLSNVSIRKNYSDVWGGRLGGSYRVNPAWTVRAGSFYESAAVPVELTNLDFVSWDRLGATAGVSWTIGAYEIAAGYAYIHFPTRDVTNSEVRQVQPLSDCQPPYDNATNCTVKVGKQVRDVSPAVAGNGIFDAAVHVGSVSLIARWE